MIKLASKGFTLIELLVVISIIGILVAISAFGLQGLRESSRDATRKADLEQIRSALELYRSDCNAYPSGITPGQPLTGSGPTCPVLVASNVYLDEVPSDPLSPTHEYSYDLNGSKYELCASLEAEDSSVTASCTNPCGSTATCNYKVTSP